MGKFRGYDKNYSNITSKKKDKPYSFVALNSEVFYPQDYGEVQDSQISFDKPFCDFLSGSLDIKLTALSDIFTGDFKAKNATDSTQMREFFKIGDKFAFSGSSVRGVLRNIAEIISFAKCKTDMPPTKDKNGNRIQRRNFAPNEKRLDCVERIFGSVGEDFALKSRISFSHFINTNNAVQTIKRTYIFGNKEETFAKGESGFKIYKHLPLIADSNAKGKNKDVKTTISPLMKGAEFSGKMRYFNLTKSELGLLLLSLTALEKYKFGGAKYYGCGSVKITINGIDDATHKECVESFKNLLCKNGFNINTRLESLKNADKPSITPHKPQNYNDSSKYNATRQSYHNPASQSLTSQTQKPYISTSKPPKPQNRNTQNPQGKNPQSATTKPPKLDESDSPLAEAIKNAKHRK